MHTRTWCAAAISAVLAGGAAAHAGPTLRLGSTSALADGAAPPETKTEWGPLIGAGYRLGPVEGEAEYSYLIASDGATEQGSHHLGGTLRVQVLGVRDTGAIVRLAVDAGLGLRHGEGRDGHEIYEGVSLAFGGDALAWMFEVRHVAGAWDAAGVACRGCAPAAPGDEAWMLEASLAFGR